LSRDVDRLAHAGLRVLAVARGSAKDGELPPRAHDFDFELVGLVGLADPIRPDVPQAVADCRTAGIRVVMITGDYPETAVSIARQIGLDGPGCVLTGAEMAAMGPSELRERARGVSVFARVLPEQKLEIVEALRAGGEVVAMTGDGVNDAPAIRASDIGVAMGGRGTDVAREASTIVLLDDDFASLVQAVRSGRRIMDNLRKALTYILAVHLPIIGLTLVPIFLGWPLVLLPIHIAFLHLVIDPACSVVFEAEPEEPDIMLRRPRAPDAPLFGRRAISISLLQGAVVMTTVVGVYAIGLRRGLGEVDSRTLTFTTFMIANLGLIFTNRSWSGATLRVGPAKNAALAWLTAAVAVFLAIVIYVPGLQSLFRFDPLHPIDVVICLAAALVSVGWFEFFKLLAAHRARPASR
jgi:Ca2+-transporting ATPase